MAHNAIHSAAHHAGQIRNAPQELSALVASRICHDLVSPMGAIGNGVELMQLVTSTPSPELSLIAESTDSATARLRFYRIAFGIVSAGQLISHPEVLSVLNALQAHQKHRVIWNCQTNLTRQQIKLMFLLLMCMETAIPWGGDIEINSVQTGVQLVARSDRLRIDDRLWAALHAGGLVEDLTSATIQFALAGTEIVTQGCAVVMAEHGNAYVLDVMLGS